MLPGVGRLIESDGGFAFHDEPVEILSQEDGDRFGEPADHAQLDIVDFVENAQGAVLEDRIRVQNEEPCFHNCESVGKK
jgi:hypothetical protein